jgi:hypothetical protein
VLQTIATRPFCTNKTTSGSKKPVFLVAAVGITATCIISAILVGLLVAFLTLCVADCEI